MNIAAASSDTAFVRKLLSLPACGYLSAAYKHSLDTVPRGQAECQWYPPRNQKRPKAIIVFFPDAATTGNPGLVEYYPPFLHKLQSLIPASYGLISLGHVGHSLSLSFQTQHLTLTEQIQVKIEFVQKLRKELDAWREEEGQVKGDAGKTMIGLMGHSVGAEIAVQTIRGLEEPERAVSTSQQSKDATQPKQRITAAFLLFPTLANIAQTPNARRLRPLFHSPLLELAPVLVLLLKPIFLVIHLAHWLFPSLRQPATSSSSIYAPNATTITMLETPIVVSHVLRLARSEMETILDPDLEWYNRNGQAGNGRVYSYWGANDGWVGKQGDAVKRALRGEDDRAESTRGEEEEYGMVERVIDCQDNIPHAFCLGEQYISNCRGIGADPAFGMIAHSDMIAEKVAEWVKHAFKQKQL
ncbi:hypothetical protein QFC21_005704 [Naganishia friedmannii]|uniref:Uncharacterized protein n=1 Tax=Naganishia friedmannii TaxID=89922 RepID=A0ACC2V884_9TREE|nr:hypothetical protein QFC21_005704 [Naganishia friedmannii]